MDPTSNPTPETLREKAAEIVAGRDYQLNSGQSDNGWVVSLLMEILEWISAPFRWLFRFTEGLPDLLRWTIVITLTVILLLLVAHIAYTIITAIRGPKRLRDKGPESRRRIADPIELERLAENAARQSDYITAVRFLFRAVVVRLELSEQKPNRPGMTNRELLRRHRDRPRVSHSLQQFVDTIDHKWYGDESCLEIDYRACRLAHTDLCIALEEPSDALSA